MPEKQNPEKINKMQGRRACLGDKNRAIFITRLAVHCICLLSHTIRFYFKYSFKMHDIQSGLVGQIYTGPYSYVVFSHKFKIHSSVSTNV